MPTRVSKFRPKPLAPLRLVALVLSLAVFAVSGHAGAADQRFHPELALALDELDRTRGPEVYAALRRVWSSWDRADPLHVEEALARAERAPTLGPAERAYAGTLWAYARLRRGDLHTARQKIRSLGYVDRWLVLGPFDNEGKAGLEAAHGPEADLASPIGGAKVYQGMQHQVRWRSATDAFPYGFLDFGALLRPEAKVCGFAASFVADQGPNPVRRRLTAWVGSGGAFRLFWNGRELASQESYSAHDFDRFAVPLTLEPGPNLLVLKVCSHESSPVASLRFSDERGAPVERLGFSDDLANAEAAAQLAAKSKGEAAPKSLSPRRGPVASFEAAVAKKNATARDLEAYARYLDATDGDDPALHLARDLARRAAEREPTIERLLLAGRLAEDRNQANDWITRAEQLASAQQQKPRDLLLARAWHRRYSPNFREALPYFEQVLELDPINIEGLRGWLELYNLVGLPRSALARLERALAESPAFGRTPRSLRGAASHSGADHRSRRGRGAVSRISLRRRGLPRRVSSSSRWIARERSAAERWAERLVSTEPHDLWALGTAARAYRRLGQTDRAITTYRRALALVTRRRRHAAHAGRSLRRARPPQRADRSAARRAARAAAGPRGARIRRAPRARQAARGRGLRLGRRRASCTCATRRRPGKIGARCAI